MPNPADTFSSKTDNTVWHNSAVDLNARNKLTNGSGMTCWLTGLSGSGKSTIAVELEKQLIEQQKPAYLLDGDNLRHGLNGDLGFSSEDRAENIRRTAHVSSLFAAAGFIAISPLVSPYQEARAAARAIHEKKSIDFIEVFVDTPLAICEERDTKGLYKKARSGEITGMTGIDDPYEKPVNPDFIFAPEDGNPQELAALLAREILARIVR